MESVEVAEEGADFFIAVDIGASSGRVMLGSVTAGSGPVPKVTLEPVHRFPNGPVEMNGELHWDFTELFEQVLLGLSKAATAAKGQAIRSVGIDTWAVDYGLLDANGHLLGEPFSYRDSRGPDAVASVQALISADELYASTGLQHLPFNTIFQLAAERVELADKQALLIPDLLAYLLTGARRTELSNASTTGLLDATSRNWNGDFFSRLELPSELFPPLIAAGESYGVILADIAARTGLKADTEVVAVGTHDTASAVAAVPARDNDFAYISSGTWSLVGVELDSPVLTAESQQANFTNEAGVDGTVRYLRNVGGLWLLSESLRHWQKEAHDAGNPHSAPSLEELLTAAAGEKTSPSLIDVDSEDFIAPGNMPARITAAAGLATVEPAAVVRCIMNSLAHAYAKTVAQAAELSSKTVSSIHVVGGGSQNALLCQLTANLTRLPVIAGPVEATVLGNLLTQARAAKVLGGELAELREVVASNQPQTRYVAL